MKALKAAIESTTFDKRVTRWSIVPPEILEIQDNKKQSDSLINYLLNLSHYRPTTGEKLLLLFKV